MLSSLQIRQTFLDFFEQKAHQIVKSAPIVVKNDPTLMFTNAGMNQFKDIFLGLKNPKSRRVADTQKCLRVSGKHNDLEEVGHDTYHHTMFEMLGNWSFGDYYKKEAIEWAWELLTARYALPKDRLYVTVFGGDEREKLAFDDDAHREWAKWIAEDHILPFGKKDNFWEMGDTGPCGPCSEIHVDLRSEEDRLKTDGKSLVNTGHPEVVEIWNLVFIQYNRKADNSLEELPDKHVDTGMGFERLSMALQQKKSTYDTDIFDHTRQFLERKTGILYIQATEAQQVAMRVIMDHIRAIVFAIGDGQMPSNTGAGYVIRRILRRASRYAFTYLNISEPFLHELVEILAQDYGHIFEEVRTQRDFIARILLEEEKGFLRKLESGTQMFEEYVASRAKRVNGDFAFKLYDTFGFPIDLTELMARERGLEIDMEGFKAHLEEQRTRSRQATETSTGDWVVVTPSSDLPRFVGYETLEVETRILQYRKLMVQQKEAYQLVLEETPFYAESGGQVGDRGTLSNGTEVLNVLDTRKENELIVHIVDRLPEQAEGGWKAEVQAQLRRSIQSNHSATHLLHAALRQVLGTHVEQRGSLVSGDLLRFDFSHFAKVTDEELAKVEMIVNHQIARNIPLMEYRDMPIEDAKKMGAMALFGEKYGDRVRVIVFDPAYSVELCGGTHVKQTGDIRLFKFASEASVAAGIRRIEAYTGDKAFSYLDGHVQQISRIAELLKNPANLEKAVADLIEREKALEKNLAQLNGEKVIRLRDELLKDVQTHKGIGLISVQVSLSSADDLKQLSFELKKLSSNTLIVLGAVIEDKPLLSVILSDDLAEAKTYNAGTLIRELAKEIQGGGGGQPFYATAGGKNPQGLAAALAKVKDLL
ncbi:MAG: alanine--tRNA ligase [Bacteroidetes bacterium]|nr:MAG: alanine--tRNA ligase [Bacteroidota bacterium]